MTPQERAELQSHPKYLRALVVRVRRLYVPRFRGAVAATWVRLLSRGRVRIVAPARRVGPALVWACSGSSVRIGSDSMLVSSHTWNPVAPAHRCSIRTIVPGASILIGSGFRATGVTIAARSSITIGDDVLVGSDVLIVDSDFHALDADLRSAGAGCISAAVVVGDGAFIGARCIILKGVTIGAGAVVGAGSVVAKNVPAGTVVAGNPARVLRAARDVG